MSNMRVSRSLLSDGGGMTAYEVARQEEAAGVCEIQGEECKRILEYHDCTLLNADEDEVSWCSSFMNFCQKEAGNEYTKSAAARSWLEWGAPCEPEEGCVAILRRPPDPKNGHVAFYVRHSDDKTKVLLLGGNQNNSVRESFYPAASVIGYRKLKGE